MPSTREQRARADVMICPHCEERIDGLRFSEDLTEYGTCDFNGENTDGHDYDNHRNFEVRCPECEEPINTDELTLPEDATENTENETEAIRASIRRLQDQNLDYLARTRNQNQTPTIRAGMSELFANDESRWENQRHGIKRAKCENPDCQKVFIAGPNDTAPECPHCGKQTNKLLTSYGGRTF